MSHAETDVEEFSQDDLPLDSPPSDSSQPSRKRRSPVYLHFDFDQESSSFNCKYCRYAKITISNQF